MNNRKLKNDNFMKLFGKNSHKQLFASLVYLVMSTFIYKVWNTSFFNYSFSVVYTERASNMARIVFQFSMRDMSS